MIIQIVIGLLGTVTKGLIKGLEDLEIRERVETIQIIALLRSIIILRRVPETWEHWLSNSVERPSTDAERKHFEGVIIIPNYKVAYGLQLNLLHWTYVSQTIGEHSIH